MKIIKSETPDVVIILGGHKPANIFDVLPDEIPILVADGAVQGLNIPINRKISILGDFDSLSSDNLEMYSKMGYEKIEANNQDFTDFEKCLHLCLARGWKKVSVVGANGGEYDHTIGNFSVTMRNAEKINICLLEVINSNNRVVFQHSIPIITNSQSEEIIYNCRSNELISLIGAPECIVSTVGLRWELEKMRLVIGQKESTRNRTQASKVSITISSGKMLLIIHDQESIFTCLGNL